MKKRIHAAVNETQESVLAEKAADKPKYSVITYVAILIIVVLLVIVLSYFIELRNHTETITSLSAQNTTAMQKIENLQSENVDLQTKNDQDKAQIDKLQAQIKDLQSKIDSMTQAQKTADGNYNQLLQQYQALQSKVAAEENAG